MSNRSNSRLVITLLAGDCLVLAITIVAGFIQHNTLDSGLLRVLVTFLSTFIAWLLVAPIIRAYDPQLVLKPKELWRPLWASTVSTPLAAFFRGLLLGAPIMPLFILVFGVTIGLAIFTWRALYLLVSSRLRQVYG